MSFLNKSGICNKWNISANARNGKEAEKLAEKHKFTTECIYKQADKLSTADMQIRLFQELLTRSSPQWLSRSTTTHDCDALICFHSFKALAKAVWLFITLFHNQPMPMYPKMCSIDIFLNLQPVGWNLKGDFSTPRFGGLRSQGWTHSIAHPWVPINSPLTHVVYLLPFLSYLTS